MELGLQGKVALVTGASRGIGAAICRELVREGVHLCLVARDATALEAVARQCRDAGGIATLTHVADLRDPPAAETAIEAVHARFGRLDVLVNNAGATRRGDFFSLTDEDWADGFALKFHGYVRMTRAAWPHLRRLGGSIVNIVGIGARAGSAEFTIGGSVNAAVLNFTKAMADLGIEHGVRVNAINPGLVETDRLARNVERLMRDMSLDRSGAMSVLLESYRTKRAGQPEEIAAVTAFLASDRAGFIHGSLIDVDGGATRSL